MGSIVYKLGNTNTFNNQENSIKSQKTGKKYLKTNCNKFIFVCFLTFLLIDCNNIKRYQFHIKMNWFKLKKEFQNFKNPIVFLITVLVFFNETNLIKIFNVF